MVKLQRRKTDDNQGLGVQQLKSEQGAIFRSQLGEHDTAESSVPVGASDPAMQLKHAQQSGFNIANTALYPSGYPSGQTAAGHGSIQPKSESPLQRNKEESVNLFPTSGGREMPGELQDSFKQAGMNHAANATYQVDDKAAKSVNALAYTTGNKIVVQEKINNNPAQLKKTLAHEGTHVEEQATMDIRPDVAGTPINASHEANAEKNEARFAQGKPLEMDGRKPSTAGTVQAKQQLSTSNDSVQKSPVQRTVDISDKAQAATKLNKGMVEHIESALSLVGGAGGGVNDEVQTLLEHAKANTLNQDLINKFKAKIKKIEPTASDKVKRILQNSKFQDFMTTLDSYLGEAQGVANQEDLSDYRSSCYTPAEYASNDALKGRYKITDTHGVISLHYTDDDAKSGGHSIVCFEYLENGVPQTVKTDLYGAKHGKFTNFQVRKIQGDSDRLSKLTGGKGSHLWENIAVDRIKAAISAAESMVEEPMQGSRDDDGNVKYEKDGDSEVFRGGTKTYKYDKSGRGLSGKKGIKTVNCARYATKVLKHAGIKLNKNIFVITPKNVLHEAQMKKYNRPS